MISKLKKSERFIRSKVKEIPQVAVILGSGMGNVFKNINIIKEFNYSDIPYFPVTSVKGHSGKLVFGVAGGKPVMIMQGRVHYYEGLSMQEITYPVRLMSFLGTKYLILTASVGAINSGYDTGDLVVLKDHINLMGDNPLRGAHFENMGERFVDMSDAYNLNLQKIALDAGKKNGIKLRRGVYIALSGPSYETPSEIKAFKKLGADVAGMSVVPETIVARQMGIKVLGICNVTNKLSFSRNRKISHKDVIKAAGLIENKLFNLLKTIIEKINT
ncbi:MAG: purine-nucleoside phosphorylase [Elusimicrobia bacterium]|nr:purine-nucleoside phosphorylase [Candidatus Liberimonas magnetica]